MAKEKSFPYAWSSGFLHLPWFKTDRRGQTSKSPFSKSTNHLLAGVLLPTMIYIVTTLASPPLWIIHKQKGSSLNPPGIPPRWNILGQCWECPLSFPLRRKTKLRMIKTLWSRQGCQERQRIHLVFTWASTAEIQQESVRLVPAQLYRGPWKSHQLPTPVADLAVHWAHQLYLTPEMATNRHKPFASS